MQEHKAEQNHQERELAEVKRHVQAQVNWHRAVGILLIGILTLTVFFYLAQGIVQIAMVDAVAE